MIDLANSSCFNATSNDTHKRAMKIIPPSVVIVQTSIFFLILAFGTVGNMLVLVVEKGKRKKKRTPNDIFIINLAISDLLFLFVNVPSNVRNIERLLFGKSQPYSLPYCAAVRPLVTMTFCVSIFTITTMAMYRCRVIVNPFKRKMKIRYALLCIAVTWVAALLAILPAILVATVTEEGICGGNWPSNKHKRLYILALLLLKFIVPLCIIAVAYLRMGFYVIQSRQRISKSTSTRLRSHSTNMGPKNKRESFQIVKTLAVMVVLFAVCTGPHQIAWMLRTYGDENAVRIAYIIYKFSPTLNNLHSCVNPVIFGALTRKFRRGYVKYMAYICCCFRSLSFCRKVISDYYNSSFVDDKSHKTVVRSLAPENLVLRGTGIAQLSQPKQTNPANDVRRVSKVCFEDICSSNGTKNRAFFGGLRVENERSIMSSQEELLPTENSLQPDLQKNHKRFRWELENTCSISDSHSTEAEGFTYHNLGLEEESDLQDHIETTFDTKF